MSKASARTIAVGVVALLLLLTWGQAEAQIPAASAEVARVAGQVSVLPKGQRIWAPATVGIRLVEGDQIRALAASSADLSLPDGSTILVAENTRFVVTKLEYDRQTRDLLPRRRQGARADLGDRRPAGARAPVELHDLDAVRRGGRAGHHRGGRPQS